MLDYLLNAAWSLQAIMITSRKQDRKKPANLTQFFVKTQYVELDLKSSGEI